MIKKFIWLNFILSFFLGDILLAVITIEKPAIYEKAFTSKSIRTAIKKRERQGYTSKAAKGLVGEAIAR